MNRTLKSHTDTVDLNLNVEDTRVLLNTLRAFNPEDTCVEHHQYTLEEAWEVIARVSLAVLDGSLAMTVTMEQVAILHCVVGSADVVCDGDYMRVEGNIYSLKMSGGYLPRYIKRYEPFEGIEDASDDDFKELAESLLGDSAPGEFEGK